MPLAENFTLPRIQSSSMLTCMKWNLPATENTSVPCVSVISKFYCSTFGLCYSAYQFFEYINYLSAQNRPLKNPKSLFHLLPGFHIPSIIRSSVFSLWSAPFKTHTSASLYHTVCRYINNHNWRNVFSR